jgi:hypothetical protein
MTTRIDRRRFLGASGLGAIAAFSAEENARGILDRRR